MIGIFFGVLVLVAGNTQQEEMDSQVVEAEQAYLKLDGTSDSVYKYIQELQDVYDLMDEDSVVSINSVSYTRAELKVYIKSEYKEAETLKHQESINEAAEECEEALGNGKTISQYKSYKSSLEKLFDLMYSVDTATINEKEYSKSEVKEEIERTDKKISKMEKLEKIETKVDKVEDLTYKAQDSDDFFELGETYEKVLNEMEEQEYGESSTVEINNEDMNLEDIEVKIVYLEKRAKNMERKERLGKNIRKYEELTNKYVDVYGYVYTTSGLLGDQVDELEEVKELMLDTEMVEIGGEYYTKKGVGELIESLENLKKDLNENDEVRVLEAGEYVLISENDFEYRLEVSEKVEKVQELTNDQNKNSENLSQLSQALFDLLDSMDKHKSVIIDGDSYTYTQIENWAIETQEDAEELEKQEKIEIEVNSLNEIYSELGDYAVKSEIISLYTHWKKLLKAVERGDEVEVYNTNYTYSEIQDNVKSYEGYRDLEPGKIYKVNEDLEFKLVSTPKVVKSSSLTNEEFLDFIEASFNYDGEDVIIASNSYSDQVLVGESEVLMEKNEKEQQMTVFLQGVSGEASEKGKDFHYGTTRFIVVTSFIQDELGTGKVFVIPKEEPMDYWVLIEGLNTPIGLCVDINHEYLYIVDKGYNETGVIFQFMIEITEDNLTVISDTAYEIYSGTPTDCKVDSYGNLYFTDSNSQSLNKVLYSDLLYHYTNTYTALYSSESVQTYPTSLDLYKDKTVFFSGNNENGTLSVADIKGQGVRVLISELNETFGVGISNKQVFYSLETPQIKVWDIEKESNWTFHSSGLITPKGICTGQDSIYVLDYDAGILYQGTSSKLESLTSFAYVQAGYSCFCINLKSTSSYSLTLFTTFLITYFL